MYPENQRPGQDPNAYPPAQPPANQPAWRGVQYSDQLPHAHDPYADLPAPAPVNPQAPQAQANPQARIGVPKAPIDNYRYGSDTKVSSNKRGKGILVWLIPLLLLLGLLAGGYYAYNSYIAANNSGNDGSSQGTNANTEELLKKALETNLSLTTFRETGTSPVPGQQATKTVVMDHDFSDAANPMTKGTLRYELPPQDGVAQWRSGDFVAVENGEEFWRLNTYEKQADTASQQAKNLSALRGDWVRYDETAKSRLVPDALYMPPGMALEKLNSLQGPMLMGYLPDEQKNELVKNTLDNDVYKVTGHEAIKFGGRPSNKLEMTVDMNKLKELNKKLAEMTKRKYVMDDAENIKKITLWSDAESGLPQQIEVEYEKSGRTNTLYSNLNQAVVISAPRNVVSEADALKPSTP